MAQQDGTGKLRVSVNTASGALPIAGAHVSVSQKDGNTRQVLFSEVTDRSGITQDFILSAPPAILSESPGGTLPYQEYEIRVRKEGFYPVIYQGVPVFSGITTTQNVALLPILEGENQPATQVYPPYSNTLEGGR